MAVPLTAKAGIDTTGFSAGVQEIRNRLTQLNTSLAENRRSLKEAEEEARSLREAQQELAAEMKNNNADEQKRKMQELANSLAQANSRISALKSTENELKSAIIEASGALEVNKQELKAATNEINNLQKAQQQLSVEMKDGGTEEQKKEMQRLSERIEQVKSKIVELKKTETELKIGIKDANKGLEENRRALKETEKEANNLRKAQQDLSSAMKNGGTEEQKRQMQELTDKLAQVNSRIGSLKTAETELRSAVRGANKELDEQYGATEKNATSASKAATATNSFATALKAVVASAATKTLVDWLIGSNAQMEQFVSSFTVMLGDAEKAQKLMSDLTDFAAVTPFELTDVIGSAQMLMNYGIAAEDVITKMTQLGNLAGGNAQKLDRVTIAYGQMLAKGKVTNEEMRQMLEAGVPILQAIADTMGVTTAEVQELASKSKIGIDELNNAIAALTSDGGKFAGMMEKQSQTMLGMASTAKDVVAEIGRDIGDAAFDKLKNKFSETMETIERLEENGTLSEWSEEIGENLATLVEQFLAFSEAAVENKDKILALTAAFVAYKAAVSIAPLINTVTTAFKALTAAMMANPYAIAAAAIAAIAVEVGFLISDLNAAAERVEEFNEKISEINGASAETVSAAQKEADAINQKVSRYDELREKVSRTAAEEAELKDIAAELQGVFGNDVTVVNSLTGEYNNLSDAVADYAEQLIKLAEVESLKEKLTELYKLRDELDAEWDAAYEETQKKSVIQTGLPGLDMMWADAFNSELESINNEYSDRILETEELISQVEEKIKTATADYYETVADATYDFSDANETSTTTLAQSVKTLDECRKSTDELAKSAKTLSSAFSEQEENGSLSTETILSLVDAGYAAALAVDAETGAVKLDAEAYRELAKAKLEAQKVDILASKAEIEAGYISRMSLAAGSGDYKAIERIKEEKDKATAELDAQLMALGAIDIDKVIAGSYGTRTKATAEGLSDEYTRAKKNLKYQFDMGEFGDDEYYNRWYALMREHGISEDSDEWRSVDVARKKYQDKLREDDEKNSAAAQKSKFTDINKAFKDASDERIKQVEKELKVKKDAADEAIAAIDAEIEARRRAKEDDDIQSEIDAVNAQLKYAQLDDFSRMQLERQLRQLYGEQADIAWERDAEARKEAIRSGLSADESAAEREKEKIKEASESVASALDRTANGISATAQQIEAAADALRTVFANLSTGAVSSAPSITNNITTNGGATTNNNTFAIGTENYTADQLVRIIYDALGNPTL